MGLVSDNSAKAGAEGVSSSETVVQSKAYLLDTAAEMERLRLHYQHLSLVALQEGKLLLNPWNKDPGAVLDLATGTANWAYDFANSHPQSKVYGVDITEGLDANPPANFKFEILNIAEDWNFPHPFDVIHGRLLMSLQIDFQRLMAQAFASLNPGGSLEFQEYTYPPATDSKQNPNAATARFFDGLVKGLGLLGQDWSNPARFDKLMEEQGFVDVHVERLKFPLGVLSEDPKENEASRIYVQEAFPRHRPMWRMVLSRTLGWTDDTIYKLIDDMLQEIESGAYQMWVEYKIVYGRKPE